MDEQQQDPPPRRSWPVWLRSLLAALAGTGVLCLLAFHPGSAPRWRRMECAEHLRQVALALHEYHQAYGCLPPAHVDGPDGKPRHSWRVLLLPFLHYDKLYRQYDFAEPWNGPKNSLLAKQIPREYRCPAAQEGIPGRPIMWPSWVPPPLGREAIACDSKTSRTEPPTPSCWWKSPIRRSTGWSRDMSFERAVIGVNLDRRRGIGSHHRGGANVSLADSSGRFLPDSVSPAALRTLLTLADGETHRRRRRRAAFRASRTRQPRLPSPDARRTIIGSEASGKTAGRGAGPITAMKILVVDDEKIKRITLADDLAAQGHEVVGAADGEEALEKLAAERFDVVVTDLKMPKLDGIELLKRIKQGPPADMEVIMMTAYGSIPVAVEAIKLGAFDFLTKPFRNEDIFPLLARIQRQREAAAAEPRPAGPSRPPTSRPRSSATRPPWNASNGWSKFAPAPTPTCCCTAKRAWARICWPPPSIATRTAGFPYVKVGCTLFPPQLIESELYGHEKGSFTGADQQRKGRFDLAEGGTLYLDDVDDIPLEQQSKLLRAIEEKVFERVGGASPIKANVRIIASTKRNLLEKIGEGTFREDLYYRLDVLRINIPPLRERREDVPLLAEYLLHRIAGRAALPDRAGRHGIARRGTIGRATSASCTTRWSGPT